VPWTCAGRETATDRVATAALRIAPDRAKLAADGEDIAMIAVPVVDAQGRIVPTASTQVAFTLAGPG
jgi:beta-galactosidase